MNLSNEIRKHFYPQFKKMGFSKHGFLWRCDIEDNWITAVEVKSEKSYKNENEAILEFDIGFFSFELDDMMGGSKEVGYRRDQLPAGIITCHFETSLFQLNETADWNKSAHHFQFFQDDGTLDAQFKSMSDKFEHVMPIARQRYATFEALIDCKKTRLGQQFNLNKRV